jgi:hypothetical protein
MPYQRERLNNPGHCHKSAVEIPSACAAVSKRLSSLASVTDFALIAQKFHCREMQRIQSANGNGNGSSALANAASLISVKFTRANKPLARLLCEIISP